MALVLKIRRVPNDEDGKKKDGVEAWDYIKLLEDENSSNHVTAEIEHYGIDDFKTTLIFCELTGTTTYYPVESIAYLLDDGKTIDSFKTTHRD